MAVHTLQPGTPVNLPFPSGHGLKIDVGGGAVSIIQSSGSDVVINCSINSQHASHYSFTAQDGAIPVITGKVTHFGFNLGVKIEVAVPAGCAIDVHVAGGSVDMGDHDSKVTCSLQGGSFKAGDLSDALEAQVSGGSVNAGDVKGPIRLRVNAGSVKLGGVHGKAEIDVTAGSIDFVFAATPEGRLHASAGSIKVGVDKAARFIFTARAQAGNVTIQSPLVPATFSGNAFNGPINGGAAATLDATTSAGNVVLRAV